MLRFPVSVLVVGLALCLAATARADFPAGWMGSWQGDCETSGSAGEMRFHMDLEIGPREGSQALSWKTTYRMEGRDDQVRDYVLLPTSNNRQWLLDEQNGISLDTYVAGEVLYQNFFFPTSTTSLTVRFERRDDTIEVDIPSFMTRPGNPSTGPGGIQVVSFHLSALQRCRLERK